ncbi:MAG: hypothetical protein FVQ82_09835 [Planctomycetes bacterium]|nr:hypothetical protein [Planctomycetota bacterium]
MWKMISKVIVWSCLLVLVFLAGFFINIPMAFVRSAYPRVYSNTRVRDEMISRIEVPENAYHLYYAVRGFVDANYYAAFSLPSKEECEEFFKKLYGGDFQRKELTELPEDMLEHGPDTWQDKYKDKNWSLKGKRVVLIKGGMIYYRFMAYVPEENRIYIKVD